MTSVVFFIRTGARFQFFFWQMPAQVLFHDDWNKITLYKKIMHLKCRTNLTLHRPGNLLDTTGKTCCAEQFCLAHQFGLVDSPSSSVLYASESSKLTVLLCCWYDIVQHVLHSHESYKRNIPLLSHHYCRLPSLTYICWRNKYLSTLKAWTCPKCIFADCWTSIKRRANAQLIHTLPQFEGFLAVISSTQPSQKLWLLC